MLLALFDIDGAFVIGDTPLDIRHGRAAGACTIAVVSAKYGMQELASHNPDYLIPDLTVASDIIGFMRGRRHSFCADAPAFC